MNIAIIDDNRTIGTTVEAVLRKNGSIMAWDNVDIFLRANEFTNACDNAEEGHYGVIICDHNLGINQPKGYEVVTLLRDSGFHGKIVLLTGDDSVSMGLKMRETDEVVYIVKNFTSKTNNAYDLLSTVIGEARV